MKIKFAVICSLAATLATAVRAQPSVSESPRNIRGAVGMCIRWDGPTHLADAMIVTGTGNPGFDNALLGYIRGIQWPRPKTYHGEWIGIAFGVGGVPANIEKPSCKDMPPPSPQAASPADKSRP